MIFQKQTEAKDYINFFYSIVVKTIIQCCILFVSNLVYIKLWKNEKVAPNLIKAFKNIRMPFIRSSSDLNTFIIS